MKKMKKLKKQKITSFLTAHVFDDRESEYCPFLIEDQPPKLAAEPEQNWLTLKEAKKLRDFLSDGIDRLEKLYAARA